MMRRLRYVMVESGPCEHCHQQAGHHAIDGLCSPHGNSHQRHADVPEPCYRGEQSYAFIDLDAPEVRAWIAAEVVA